MWTKINISPEPYGICTICSKHDCGIYKDDNGFKQEGWLIFSHEMFRGGYLTIGHSCVESMASDLEINKIVSTIIVREKPTDEEIVTAILKDLNKKELIIEKKKEEVLNKVIKERKPLKTKPVLHKKPILK